MNYQALISLGALREWNQGLLKSRGHTEETKPEPERDESDREFWPSTKIWADYSERMKDE